MGSRKDNKGRVLQRGECQRKDGYYMYRYQDLYGKRKCIYDKNLSKLREKEKKIKNDLDDFIDSNKAKRTLNEQFDLYLSLKGNLELSTRSVYESLWNSAIREKPIGRKQIGSIKRSDILSLYNGLLKTWEYGSVKNLNKLLSPTLELAVDDDIIRKNPCKGCIDQFSQREKKEKEALTESEQGFLLEYLKENDRFPGYYQLFLFMLETGLRCGEVAGLTWEDVDLKRKTISVDHQILCDRRSGMEKRLYASHPKTNAGVRVVPLTEEAVRALKEQKEFQFAKSLRSDIIIDGYKDFVFTSATKKPVVQDVIYRRVKSVVKAINGDYPERDFPKITPHILRHTACTRMAEMGMDIRVLQKIMGHGDISITMDIYNHVSEDRGRMEIDKLDELRKIKNTQKMHQIL